MSFIFASLKKGSATVGLFVLAVSEVYYFPSVNLCRVRRLVCLLKYDVDRIVSELAANDPTCGEVANVGFVIKSPR